MATDQLQYRLERAGWTKEKALENPEERIPVPSPPYPPNRHYHFVADQTIAVIVDQYDQIVGSVPGREAWESIHQHSPHMSKTPGKPALIKINGHGGWVIPTVDLSAPWMTQTILMQGGTWTIHARQGGGGTILLNQEVVGMYEHPHELEERDEIPDIVLEAAWLIQRQGK